MHSCVVANVLVSSVISTSFLPVGLDGEEERFAYVCFALAQLRSLMFHISHCSLSLLSVFLHVILDIGLLLVCRLSYESFFMLFPFLRVCASVSVF